jgi:CubicO group peptidase (beta-lactamase class C family)
MSVEAPESVRRTLADAIAARVTPGGVVAVGTAASPVYTLTLGRVTYAREAAPVDVATVYDLASLTKVLATTPLALVAHAAGPLPLETAIGTRLVAFERHGRATVQDLLEHAAGFPAHRPYFREVAGRAGYLARIAAEPADYVQRTAHIYTDLGFILLGLLLEDAAGAPLATQFDRFVHDVVPDAEIAFGVAPAWRMRVAPTGVDPWRGRVMAGHVHDSNAAALGGAAGHAGLFGTAAAVAALARWWMALTRGTATSAGGVPAALAARATARGAVPGSSRGLGWDVDTRVRPHRLHGHVALDRSGARSLRGVADQPRARVGRHGRHSPSPHRGPRRGGRGVGRRARVRRQAGATDASAVARRTATPVSARAAEAWSA